MSDPVDLTNLREMTDGDTELEQELFAEFISSSEECLAIMSENCTDGENEAWRSNAHALKGTSINLGADTLAGLCKDAQENHAANSNEKQGMLETIKKEYEAVKAFLESAM